MPTARDESEIELHKIAHNKMEKCTNLARFIPVLSLKRRFYAN